MTLGKSLPLSGLHLSLFYKAGRMIKGDGSLQILWAKVVGKDMPVLFFFGGEGGKRKRLSGGLLQDACCVAIKKEISFQYQILVTFGVKVCYLHIGYGCHRPCLGSRWVLE